MNVLRRIQHLEQQFGQSDNRRLVRLAAAALRGDEEARIKLIDLYHHYTGTSHLPDLVRISGLLEGPVQVAGQTK